MYNICMFKKSSSKRLMFICFNARVLKYIYKTESTRACTKNICEVLSTTLTHGNTKQSTCNISNIRARVCVACTSVIYLLMYKYKV